ncbi:MAG TPA: hypothetical protein VL995_05895 [Cellvibrio sp.]|nr:hypothetical protein [Cellvibrio sp.]
MSEKRIAKMGQSFDPHKAFFELTVVKWTIGIGIVLAMLSIITIAMADPRPLNWTAAGFNEAFKMLKVPMWILGAVAALLALYATNHRSEQNKKAMLLTQMQNRFSNYFKNIEELEDYINRHFKSDENRDSAISIGPYLKNIRCRVNSLHGKMYPKAKTEELIFSSDLKLTFYQSIDSFFSYFGVTDFANEESIKNLIIRIDKALQLLFDNSLSGAVNFVNSDEYTFVNSRIRESGISIPQARLMYYIEFSLKKIEILREIFCFDEDFDSNNALRDIIFQLKDVLGYIPEIAIIGEKIELKLHTEVKEEVLQKIQTKVREFYKNWLNLKEGSEFKVIYSKLPPALITLDSK